MALSRAGLGETEHALTRTNLKLLIRSRLQISLLHGSLDCFDLVPLVASGLWITRGNGFNLSVRLELVALAGQEIWLENFVDGLSDVLCTAKLWPQLSLKASRANNTTTNDPRLCDPIDLNFGISYLESSNSSLQRNRGGLSPAPSIWDVKPPSGVPIAFLNSIELTFTIESLPPPENPVESKSGNRSGSIREGIESRYTLRSRRNVSYEEAEDSLSDQLSVIRDEEDANKDLLFASPRWETENHGFEMLDLNYGDTNILLFTEPDLLLFSGPEPEPQPSILSIPISPITQALPPIPHRPPPPNPLDLLKLIDASLRHTISGTPPATRSSKKATPADVELTNESSKPSLADIAPALFRPGYMKAIAARGPLISRIASSLSAISSRSHTPIQPLSSQPSSAKPLTPTSSDLQPRLWRLLQKRKWPTTPLEPLDCDDMSVFERCERDRMMMFDEEGFGDGDRRVMMMEDEDMLDNYTYIDADDMGMLEEEEDDDLFSSFESTPWTSQDTGTGGGEMMLEDEEELLLEDEWSSSSPRGEIGVSWLQESVGRHGYVGEAMSDHWGDMNDGYKGMDVDLEMLF